MWLWMTQMTIISILLIFLVHYLVNFFKSTLTIPKIKDLVNIPNQKYEEIYNIIKNDTLPTIEMQPSPLDYTLIDLLPKKEEQDPNAMKNELKNFLKKQMNESNSLDEFTNETSYSRF